MSAGLERILTLTFGTEGNEANHLGLGWSAAEPGHRWMVGQASELWLNDPGQGHDLILEIDADVVTVPGLAAQRLAVVVRDVAVAQIACAHPATVGIHVPAARIASPGPVRLLFLHPDCRASGTDTRELSFSLRGLRISRVLARVVHPSDALPPPDQMITAFESLGDNCEFGLVQRHLGAEPLGLLRFSFIDMPSLRRGLLTAFAGLGDPGTVEVEAKGADREYVAREHVFNITSHTFQREDQIGRDAITEQVTTRFRFLKRKLMEDIANAEKIFVIKRNVPLRPEEVLPIFVALNELGANWLLWVLPADAAHPPGTLEVLLPGLMRGYVERFGPYDNAPDIVPDPWIAMCQTAWRLAGRRS